MTFKLTKSAPRKSTLAKTALTAAALLGMGGTALAQAASLPVSIERDDRFLILSDKGIAAAFPNAATRPSAIFMTKDRQVSVSLEYRSSTLSANQVTTLLTQYPPVMRKNLPSITSLNADMVRIGGNQWAQFVATLPSKNGERRLEQLMTSVNNRPLVVTIDGTAAGYKANEVAVRNLVNSIQVMK